MGSSQPFRRDSYRNPNGVREDSGSGSGKGFGLARRTTHLQGEGDLGRARFEQRMAWAGEHFPDQHPPFVAAAYATVAGCLRRDPTVEEVRRRLEVCGQLRSQRQGGDG